MELSSELKETLFADSNHKSVKVFYHNGKKVEGIIGKKDIMGNSFNIGLKQFKYLKSENPIVYLDFEEILKIEIKFNNGDVVTYN